MKIISWNIYFDVFEIKNRTENICKEILKYDPDVICLQEVSYFSWIIIKEILCKYYQSAFENPYKNNTSSRTYGEVILTKFEIKDKGFFKLNSLQGRVCSWIDIEYNNKLIRINTSHLESFRDEKSKKIRQIQLNEICENNKELNWIWIGDSNLDNTENHDMCNTPFNTYFSNRYHTNNFEHSYDKVWFSDVFQLENITYIGENKVNGIWLSDHNGLLVIFK